AARVSAPRGEPIERGMFGAAWLFSTIVYYAFHNFWDTAQCEIWVALFAMLGLVAAMRGASPRRSYVLVGVCCALCFFTKPPSVPFIAIVIGAAVMRARRDGGRRGLIVALAWLAGGGIAVSAAIVGYFIATGS